MDKSFVDRVSEITKEILLNYINLSTAARVINVSEYSSSQVIDVLPLINSLDEDGEAIELPPIYRVPVCLQEAGGALFSLPVKVGDRVKLDFSKFGLDSYLSSSGQEALTPLDKRGFSLTDCFATLGCPTLSSNLSPNPDDVEIKFAGSSWKMKPNGDVTLDVAGNYDVTVTGDYNVNATNINLNT